MTIKELNTELQSSKDISDIVTSDILIIYMEDVFPIYLQQVISTIIGERVRRLKYTMILSNTPFEILTKRFPIFSTYNGDGKFKTLKVMEGV